MTLKSDEKKLLRTELRAKRHVYHQGINQTIIDRQLITQWKRLSFELLPNLTVAGYYPQGSEVNILELMNYIHITGYKLALPQVNSQHEISFKTWSPDATLVKDLMNIPAPIETANSVIPDVIIVPLIGFDLKGYRLGQGLGFYDKTLNKLKEIHEIITIGVGYSCQQVDSLPIDEWDVQLDYVLTPETVYCFKKLEQ